jgi:hypothetical protein
VQRPVGEGRGFRVVSRRTGISYPRRTVLWVCAELAKAIRTESAAALKHHFGVSTGVVWRWRKAFGVGGRDRDR